MGKIKDAVHFVFMVLIDTSGFRRVGNLAIELMASAIWTASDPDGYKFSDSTG